MELADSLLGDFLEFENVCFSEDSDNVERDEWLKNMDEADIGNVDCRMSDKSKEEEEEKCDMKFALYFLSLPLERNSK